MSVLAYIAERLRSKWTHYLWLLGFYCTGRS